MKVTQGSYLDPCFLLYGLWDRRSEQAETGTPAIAAGIHCRSWNLQKDPEVCWANAHVQVSTSYLCKYLQDQDLPFWLGGGFQGVKESSYPSAITSGSFFSWWWWSLDYELILHAQFCLKKRRELEIFPLPSRKWEYDDIKKAASQSQKYFPSSLSWPSFSKLPSCMHLFSLGETQKHKSHKRQLSSTQFFHWLGAGAHFFLSP